MRKREEPHTRCSECPIREMALFEPVDQEQLDWTQRARSAQLVIPARRHLYREGEVSNEAYTLFDGWVILYRSLPNGKAQIMRFALPGDFLALHPDHDGPRTHSAQAVTQSTVCVFPRGELVEMLHTHPKITMRLNWIHTRDMTTCQEHLLGIGRKSAEERIAFLLMELFQRMRLRGKADGNRIAFPITQEHIADAVGLTVVHTNRIMRQLRDAQLIDCSRQSLTILNEKGLAELGNFRLDMVEMRHLI